MMEFDDAEGLLILDGLQELLKRKREAFNGVQEMGLPFTAHDFGIDAVEALIARFE